MAYWTEIDENNFFIRTIITDDNDPNGDKGYSFIQNNLSGRWIESSMDGSIRKVAPGFGSYYDEDLDIFVLPKPFESWIFNEEKKGYYPPIEYPNDEGIYTWNESTLSWDLAE